MCKDLQTDSLYAYRDPHMVSQVVIITWEHNKWCHLVYLLEFILKQNNIRIDIFLIIQ